MTRTGFHAAPAWLTLVLAACGSVQLAPPARDVSPPAQRPFSRVQIAQQAHGSAAKFVACVPPNCPTPTRKTLAIDAGGVPARPLAPASHPASVAAPASAPQRPHMRTHDPESLTVVASFAVGSTALADDARRALDAAAAAAHPVRRIRVVARTDASGPAMLNDALARARAGTVVQHLRSRHSELPDRIEVDARGRCCYAASNRTPHGRAANRRAEITFETAGDAL